MWRSGWGNRGRGEAGAEEAGWRGSRQTGETRGRTRSWGAGWAGTSRRGDTREETHWGTLWTRTRQLDKGISKESGCRSQEAERVSTTVAEEQSGDEWLGSRGFCTAGDDDDETQVWRRGRAGRASHAPDTHNTRQRQGQTGEVETGGNSGVETWIMTVPPPQRAPLGAPPGLLG